MKTRLALAMLAASAAAIAQNSTPLPGPGNVTLPLDEYNRLLELAAKPARRAEAPPLPYALRTAQMNLAAGSDTVAGSIALDGEVFANGSTKAPLVSGMIVRSAQQNGKDLPLLQEAGVHTAVLAGPAEFAVTLEASLPLTIETGRASFNVAAPAAGAVRPIRIRPGEETLVHLTPGLITSRVSKDGRTVIEATLVPGQTANIWWAARLATGPAAAPKEARFLSDVKTLVSLTEAELTIASLAEITVVQGEPSDFRATAPAGYEFTGATGPTLASADIQQGTIVLTVNATATRAHQFLISLVRATQGAAAEVPFPSFSGAQRETGEVLIEAEGAVELTATGAGGLRRMDLKEASPTLRSLAHGAVHTAFRYQKRAGETPSVALEWVRFPETKVLSATAQNAVITTLVTSEGRSLSEIKLKVRNQAQPFLKVALPAGATILSAEVAEEVKPVSAPDGSRVPLLRPGFRPPDWYFVSFVFLHSGAPRSREGRGSVGNAETGRPDRRYGVGGVSTGAVPRVGVWRRCHSGSFDARLRKHPASVRERRGRRGIGDHGANRRRHYRCDRGDHSARHRDGAASRFRRHVDRIGRRARILDAPQCAQWAGARYRHRAGFSNNTENARARRVERNPRQRRIAARRCRGVGADQRTGKRDEPVGARFQPDRA